MNQNPYHGPVYSKESVETATKANRAFSNYDRSQGARVFVDGPYLVVETGSVLPCRCPVTNEPLTENMAEPRLFTWTPDYLIFFFLCCSLPIFLVAYFVLRQQCTVWLTISPMVKSTMNRRVLQRMAFVLISMGTIAASIYLESGPGAVVGVFMLMISLFICLIPVFRVRVSKYENGLFWLKGCHPDFLNVVANGDYSIDKRLF